MDISFMKKLATAFIGLPLLAVILFIPASGQETTTQDDTAAFYKAKCAMCHGAKAEKKFDPAKADEHHVQAILKGVDGKPKMPSYEKSVNEEQAKALVAYMRQLKQ